MKISLAVLDLVRILEAAADEADMFVGESGYRVTKFRNARYEQGYSEGAIVVDLSTVA